MCFLANIPALSVTDFGSENSRIIRNIINSLIWSDIWFVFTYKSEQIKRLFPKENRKVKLRLTGNSE